MTADDSLRKPGEMFTASALKGATPVKQFIFITILGILLLIVAKYALHSDDLVMYAGCFGVVFYVMFNPWLCLLATDNKKYLITSFIFYAIITVVMYGIVYLMTGKYFSNSWEVRIILITTTFYMVVAYGMMLALKMLFVDVSEGGL
ncbi:MAG: hypothetical protein JSS76_01985 [Bacteroidetes bacterium]|nr:hypothetical protein [Bacteroidota bacterium]MBS1683492.1 hypothetical protein [Bacteroidota bacterium]